MVHDLLKDDDWNIVSEVATVTRLYLVKGDNPVDAVKNRTIAAAYIEHNDLVDDSAATYTAKKLSDKDRSDGALVKYARFIMEDITPAEPEAEPVKRRRKRRKTGETVLTPAPDSATIDLLKLGEELGFEKV